MIRYIVAATVVFCALASNAEARSRHIMPINTITIMLPTLITTIMLPGTTTIIIFAAALSLMPPDTVIMAEGGKPRAWCGWYMRGQVGADPGPSYNLARSWAHYGYDAGVRRSVPSWFGVTMSARSSVRKTASGLCKRQ